MKNHINHMVKIAIHWKIVFLMISFGLFVMSSMVIDYSATYLNVGDDDYFKMIGAILDPRL